MSVEHCGGEGERRRAIPLAMITCERSEDTVTLAAPACMPLTKMGRAWINLRLLSFKFEPSPSCAPAFEPQHMLQKREEGEFLMPAKDNAHGALANDCANVHRTRRYRRDWQWQRHPARVHIIQRADVIPEHKRAIAKLPCFVVTSALKLAADTHDVAT